MARIYIDFFRRTPLIVQIFMVYFGVPALIKELGFELTFNRFVAAVLALSLDSAAYTAEIVQGGIASIEAGQTEAAESLGLDSFQTMRFVIFPQALRRMLPPLGNQFIYAMSLAFCLFALLFPYPTLLSIDGGGSSYPSVC